MNGWKPSIKPEVSSQLWRIVRVEEGLKVLVLDNYDSFVYNIVQYVAELGGRPIIFRNNRVTIDEIENLNPDRIIISPGPGTPLEEKYFGVCGEVITRIGPKTPLLGVCLGHQGIVVAFGGEIIPAKRLMHGKTSPIEHDGQGIFYGVSNPFIATRYHSFSCNESSLPTCLKVTARSKDDMEIMGVRHIRYPIEGVQFHPESIMTRDGKKIIENFLRGMPRNDS
jgi:anthranilate synthase component 2